jgi:exonuclease VII large subunit
LAFLSAQCRALSPEQTLSRGYSIVRSKNGKVVLSSHEIHQTEILEVSFALGVADVQVLALKYPKDGH